LLKPIFEHFISCNDLDTDSIATGGKTGSEIAFFFINRRQILTGSPFNDTECYSHYHPLALVRQVPGIRDVVAGSYFPTSPVSITGV
jgi:hypothetical protein